MLLNTVPFHFESSFMELFLLSPIFPGQCLQLPTGFLSQFYIFFTILPCAVLAMICIVIISTNNCIHKVLPETDYIDLLANLWKKMRAIPCRSASIALRQWVYNSGACWPPLGSFKKCSCLHPTPASPLINLLCSPDIHLF